MVREKTNKILITVLICCVIFIIAFIFIIFGLKNNKISNNSGENKNNEAVASKRPFGVWWWDSDLDIENYLNFAQENGINEIYYCDSLLDENVSNFITEANKRGIDVFLLAGEKEWLLDRTKLENLIEKYTAFQSQNENIQFKGLHLDIEPHQFDDFDEKRQDYIFKLIELADYLKTTYANISFDYDIPFWFDDEIEYKNETKSAYKHMIDIADRVFVMSYRDTAEKIYEVGKDEVQYAQNLEKRLFLCVETKSSEGDKVSFMEEGKEYMNQELMKLKELIPSNFGISIHQIKTWFDL